MPRTSGIVCGSSASGVTVTLPSESTRVRPQPERRSLTTRGISSPAASRIWAMSPPLDRAGVMRIVGLFDAAVPLALTVVDVVDDLLLDGTRQTGPVVGRTPSAAGEHRREHRILGFIGRKVEHHRTEVIAVGVFDPVLRELRRTGLAGDLEERRIAEELLGRTGRTDLFEALAYLAQCRRGADLVDQHPPFGTLDHLAAAPDFAHEPRGDHAAVVGHGVVERERMQRRQFDGIAVTHVDDRDVGVPDLHARRGEDRGHGAELLQPYRTVEVQVAQVVDITLGIVLVGLVDGAGEKDVGRVRDGVFQIERRQPVRILHRRAPHLHAGAVAVSKVSSSDIPASSTSASSAASLKVDPGSIRDDRAWFFTSA